MEADKGRAKKHKPPREEAYFETSSPDETRRLGQSLGQHLRARDVVLLTGDLGSGKTTFCKGVGLGADVEDEITSPTFTLIAEYEGRIPLAHMDLYRIAGDPRKLDEIGWDDYVEGEYAVLVEWPLTALGGLDDVMHVQIERPSLMRFQSRRLHAIAVGTRSTELLKEWVTTWESS